MAENFADSLIPLGKRRVLPHISFKKRQSSPVTSLELLRGFQEIKVPRLHDNGTGWW